MHDLLNARNIKGVLRAIDEADKARMKSRSRNIKRALKAIDEADRAKREFGAAIPVMFDALYRFAILSPELVALIVAKSPVSATPGNLTFRQLEARLRRTAHSEIKA
ncbi:MAG: hypothetical protein A3K61_05940 [Thaumarchaeota archaeon RBG_16_49_8]|nr:MAG: hypothetical protein A3K61_05940 [Thaumarchaeota archaeon RBG_16_49_8]